MKRAKRIAPSLFVMAALLCLFFLPMRIVGANEQPPVAPQEHWQQAIAKIDLALANGELSVDEAAMYRFYALSDPHRLPPAYQPSEPTPPTDRAQPEQPPHDSLWPFAERWAALFKDEAMWRTETRNTILTEMEQGEQAILDDLNVISPTQRYFQIHWDNTRGPNTPPSCLATLPACEYIEVISQTLEYAYDEFLSMGYEMPAPAFFGKDQTLSRFLGGQIRV